MKNLENLIMKLAGLLSILALLVTSLSVNTACMLIAYQPKLPEAAMKLRKY